MTGAASTGSSAYVTLACVLVVVLYAYTRYDTPDTNRLSTTRSLFIITGICYILSSLAMFFILSEVVLKPGVLPMLGLDDAQKLITQFSAPPSSPPSFSPPCCPTPRWSAPRTRRC